MQTVFRTMEVVFTPYRVQVSARNDCDVIFTGSVGLIKSLLGAAFGYAACHWHMLFTNAVDVVSGGSKAATLSGLCCVTIYGHFNRQETIGAVVACVL